MSEQPVKKTDSGLQENVAGLLCYLLGWVTGVIFLFVEKENKVVRFHAWQSIFVFGAYSVLWIIIGWIPLLGWIVMAILGILVFILWLMLMFRAYNGKMWKLPIAGGLAEKYANPVKQQSNP